MANVFFGGAASTERLKQAARARIAIENNLCLFIVRNCIKCVLRSKEGPNGTFLDSTYCKSITIIEKNK